MLSHTYRFHGHGSLRYLYQHGRTARSKHLMVRYTPNNHRTHSRATVIVSKKVLKSAAKRNRIRRRIYEILRNKWLELNGTYDIAVTVFSAELLVLPSDELAKELHTILNSAGILTRDK